MKPRNRLRSKNSGALRSYSSARRCAVRWHRLSSSAVESVRGPFLHQQRDRDVVALEGLREHVGDDAQAEGLVGLAHAPAQHAAVGVGLEQAQFQEHVDGLLDLGAECVGTPGQEQLVAQERIDELAQALDGAAAQAAVVEEAARDPGGGGEQVQHVVAEVREQHGLVALGHQHVAERMLDPGDPVHALAVGDRSPPRVIGVMVTRSEYGTRSSSALAARIEAQQVGLAHGVARRGQQRHRQQVDRIDVGGAVDVGEDAVGEVADRATRTTAAAPRPRRRPRASPARWRRGARPGGSARRRTARPCRTSCAARPACAPGPGSIPSPWACPTAR